MQSMKPFHLDDFTQENDFKFFIQLGNQQGDFLMHRHEDFCEAVIVTDGSALHIVEDESYPVNRGDVFVISGKTSHGFQNAKDFKPCNIMFDPAFFSASAQELVKTPGFQALFVVEPNLAQKSGGVRARLKLSPEDYETAYGTICDMFNEQALKMSCWKTKFKTDFLSLCIHLSRCYENGSSHKNSDLYSIAEALAQIEKGYLSDLSVTELARLSNYSQRQFLRIFKNICGCTPTEYIRKRRIKDACRMLRSSPEPITRIAAECGYSDSNYFSRAFKAETGLTPKSYRHQVRAPAPMSPTHQDFAQTNNTSPPSPEGRQVRAPAPMSPTP